MGPVEDLEFPYQGYALVNKLTYLFDPRIMAALTDSCVFRVMTQAEFDASTPPANQITLITP